MRKKIFTFLLALVASVGLMNAAVDGKLPGAFTVDGSGTQVYFSQGNLQYVGGNWQFAENQWDVIGTSQTNSSRDLFGWGTGNNPNQTSEEYEDYTTFADWGSNMGGDWQTLTRDEWLYIFNTRTSASDLRGSATVCDVHGYIILPDNFVLPGGLSWTPRPNDWTTNVYTSQEWSSMEENGAVFLPAAGYREGTTVHYDESAWGYYWSATEHAQAYYAYNVWVADENDYVRVYYRDRTYGHSVRLVSKATPAPTPSWVRDGDDWDDATKTLTVNSNPGKQAYQSIAEIQHVVINNSVTSIDSEVFRYCTGLTSVTIPNSVTSIGYQVFNGCTGLTSVAIPSSVTSIASSLFYGCSSLTSVTIPNSVTSIGNSAFRGCTGLTSVTIPNSVTSIDMQAFYGCTGLTSVTIPNSVTSIEYFAFDGCTNVTDVYCYPLAADLTWNIANNSFKANKATQCHVFASELSAYQDKFGTSVRVTFVGDLPAPTPNPSGECGAQGDNLLWDLDPNTGVLTITGSGAMNDWPDDTNLPWYDNRLNITSVVLPSGITSIGTKAFRGCNNLASINITENYPAGLTAINQEAFCNTALTSIIIPESVVTIGQDAFYLSQAITDVYCYADPNNLTWTDFWCDDFNKTPAKSTQCHVKDCYLAVYNSKWNTSTQSTDVNVTFVGDLPGDCPAPTPTPAQDGDKLPGVFSVSADKAVCFSKGNLQYDSENQIWQFAANQWDYIGNAAGNTAITVDGIPDNSGIVDLFGWVGASSSWITGSTKQYGISASTTNNDYGNVYGEALKQDWGNTMGSDWRTLSKDEWNYLLNSRNNAANLRTLATVNSKPGLILMPDGWTASGVSLTVTKENYTDNTIGSSDWSTLEEQGCVFLPAAGSRNGNWVMSAGTKGHYWSSTSRSTGASLNSFKLVFMADDVDPTDYTNRYTGLSVRLVSETAPTPTPTPTDEQVVTNEDPENPGTYYYSTFFHSTQNYKLTNDGTQAFIATLSNNDLVLTKIAEGTQVIPANTAVIFRKSGSADPVVLNPTEENGVSVNPNDNDLEGVDVATPLVDLSINQAECYVLSGTAQYGVGFYRINSENLKAHKAYVIYSGSNAPKRMRFVFNQEQTATGIDNANADIKAEKRIENGVLYIIKNGVRYNVQGQIVK